MNGTSWNILSISLKFNHSGLAERVDYAPGTGPLALFPAARLEACSSDERCPGVTRIQAAVTLQASRAGVACDRDTYTLHAQRTVCGTYSFNLWQLSTSTSLYTKKYICIINKEKYSP